MSDFHEIPKGAAGVGAEELSGPPRAWQIRCLGWKGRLVNISDHLCCSYWGTKVRGKTHSPLCRNHIFLPSGSYPSKTCKLPWLVLACPDPLPGVIHRRQLP